MGIEKPLSWSSVDAWASRAASVVPMAGVMARLTPAHRLRPGPFLCQVCAAPFPPATSGGDRRSRAVAIDAHRPSRSPLAAARPPWHPPSTPPPGPRPMLWPPHPSLRICSRGFTGLARPSPRVLRRAGRWPAPCRPGRPPSAGCARRSPGNRPRSPPPRAPPPPAGSPCG
jgi:hypothetical protein